MVCGSSVSKTRFLPTDPNELWNRLKLLLQGKQIGKNSIIFDEEINALADKLLEYKCISKKQDKQMLIKCNPFHSENK